MARSTLPPNQKASTSSPTSHATSTASKSTPASTPPCARNKPAHGSSAPRTTNASSSPPSSSANSPTRATARGPAATWNAPEFFESLRERGVGFVNIDQPPNTGIAPTGQATAPVAYIRLHGRNLDNWFRDDAAVTERYDYLYSAEELQPWLDRARALERESEQLFIITNNHFEGKAEANAAMLRAAIENQPAPVPPTLFDAYPEALQAVARPF